jgi:nucleotide-binding universal stress UspA family protein
MYEKIILAYDGSQEGQKALINCKEMATWGNAEIHLTSIIAETIYSIGEGTFIDSESPEIQKTERQRQLDNGVELIKKEGFKCIGALLVGNSVKEISIYAAKVSADLIVIGHKHNDSVFGRWWARSTSSNLVEESPCNVLIVVT